MTSILHIESISRNNQAPIDIGDVEYLFYGEGDLSADENIGNPAASMLLGDPLSSVDVGSTNGFLPLVKTFEYSPDFSRSSGNIFTETIHYVKDKKFLIPFRTKVRSGLSNGMRFNHIPSLNFIRHDITGIDIPICDPKPEMVHTLLHSDRNLKKSMRDSPLEDWAKGDLVNSLSHNQMCGLQFDSSGLVRSLDKFTSAIHSLPSMDTSAKCLDNVVGTLRHNLNSLPMLYLNDNPIIRPFDRVMGMMSAMPGDLKSFGSINLDSLPQVMKNPKGFGSIIEYLDNIHLTDINVDIILADRGIHDIHIHTAMDRITQYQDSDLCHVDPNEILTDRIIGDPQIFFDILEKFLISYPGLDDTSFRTIVEQPIKMKIIKTIIDESAILLFRYNCDEKEPPICGVYFDIAALSLSPMTIVRNAVDM